MFRPIVLRKRGTLPIFCRDKVVFNDSQCDAVAQSGLVAAGESFAICLIRRPANHGHADIWPTGPGYADAFEIARAELEIKRPYKLAGHR